MKKQLLAGVSALAFVGVMGIGAAAHANPTVLGLEDIDSNSDVEIGVVDIEVFTGSESGIEIEDIDGGDADGGNGGSANGGDANAYAGAEGGSVSGSANGGEGGWAHAEGLSGASADANGGTLSADGSAEATGGTGGDGGEGGMGGMGGVGGAATATNTVNINIENDNVAVVSWNNLEAENYLSFDDFVNTGHNDSGGNAYASGGEGGGSWAGAEGGSSGSTISQGAEGGYAGAEGYWVAKADASVDQTASSTHSNDATATADSSGGDATATGGAGGSITTGNADFSTGNLRLSDNALQYAAGQFVVNAATGLAGNANLGANSVGAHVPVGISVAQ